MIFDDIKIQQFIDELCSEYRRLDKQLKHPKHKLPMSFDQYINEKNDSRKIMISKYFRNIGALEKLESMINHLDPFFIAVEYFQSNINLERIQGNELDKRFKNKLFLKIAADSLRASFDVYAKFVAWFFDLPNRKDVGFSYKYFIKKLQKYSTNLSEHLNEIYKSDYYKTVNDFRNADKHIGFDRFELDITRSSQKYEIKTKRIYPLNENELETSLVTMCNSLLEMTIFTVDEFSKFELGYNSKNDFEAVIGDDGFIRI